MRKLRKNVILAAILMSAAAIVFEVQLQIFHNPDEALFLFFQDLTFVPFEALIVTLVLDRFLSILEREEHQKRIHVLINAFFTDIGLDIMVAVSRLNQNHNQACEIIRIEDLISNKRRFVEKKVSEFEFQFYADSKHLGDLANAMNQKRDSLIRLLENSNLMEHASFTDMLWAVFHVADELRILGEYQALTKTEIQHLSEDVKRAYKHLILEWIDYIAYLRKEYPYLYKTAVVRNPFCPYPAL